MQSGRNPYIEFIEKEKALSRHIYKTNLKQAMETAWTNDKLKDYLNGLFKIVETNKKAQVRHQINDIMSKKTDNKDKIDKIAETFMNSGIFDSGILFAAFAKHISNEHELNQFLTNPVAFLKTKKCSPADIVALETIGKGENLKNYCLAKGIKAQPFTGNISQSLQKVVFSQYISNDATRFMSCINPTVKDEVLEKSKRPDYSGIQEIGLAGALKSADYSRKNVEETAKKVWKKKRATCQTFAQLGADLLLKEMESGKIPRENVKIVSHQQDLGSHTFVLVGHNNDDLTDLSKCVFVDPWAAAMGHSATNGVFTLANYPYPGMIDNLICVYESNKDKEHQARCLGNKENINTTTSHNMAPNVSQPHSTSITSNSLFSKPALSPKEETLGFFTCLLNIFVANKQTSSNEYTVLYYLNEQFKNDKISREKALVMAIDVFFNMDLSKNITEKSFSWKQESIAETLINHSKNSEVILKAFNKYNSVKEFCINCLKDERVLNSSPKELNNNHIIGLSHIICQKNYDRTFKMPELSNKPVNGR